MITQTKHHARYALLVQYFLMGFVYASLLSRFPAIQTQYGLSVGQLSYILLSMSIGSLCIMPFCCHLIGRFGSKKLSITGLIYILMLPFLTCIPFLPLFFLSSFIYGIFVTLADVSINGNSIIVENAYKKPIISTFHALYYVGVCCGAFLSIFCISHEIPVRYHHFGVALFSASLFLYIRRFFLKETIVKKSSIEKKPLFLLPKGMLLLIAFIALCSRVTEGSFTNWSTIYMKTIITFPENLAPLGLAIYAAFMSIGRFAGDSIRKRFDDPTILLSSCVVTSIGILIIVISTSSLSALTGFIITGLGISCLVPIIYSLAGRQKDVTPGQGIAMVNTISSTAFLFGPFVIGLIADSSDMRGSYTYILLLSLIMLLLSYQLRKRKQKHQQEKN